MTEKEKAKAYDEAIERAKKLYSNGIAEEIFPELKESEDEKIRKEIISILRNTYWTSNRNRFNELVAWFEKQGDKDKLIQELGEYKVKYTQEILEKHITSMSNKDDERLRKNTISFLKEFAELGYENAVECIDWLEKQDEQKPCMVQWKGDNLKEVISFTGKDKNFEKWFKSFEEYEKYVHEHNDIFKLFDENGNHYEIPVGAWIVKTPDGYNIASNAVLKQKSANKIEPKFKVGDRIRHKVTNKDDVYEITKVYDDSYGIAGFNWVIYIKYQDQYELVPNKFDPKTLKPFDRVLVRDRDIQHWICNLFSHIINNEYLCIGSCFIYCIPYNDDTKHLVGTKEEAPEYYRYWED